MNWTIFTWTAIALTAMVLWFGGVGFLCELAERKCGETSGQLCRGVWVILSFSALVGLWFGSAP